AFSDTSPVVFWSSSTLDALPSKFSHSHSLLDTILSSSDICGHDAIVLVDQPELHASDLRNLPSNTHLARSLSSSPSSRQFPYVPNHAPIDLTALLTSAATRCDSRLVSFAPGQGISLSGDAKHVVSLSFPPLAGMAEDRKDAMLKYDALLATELATLTATFPNHLIIYTGSSAPSFAKRAAPITGSIIRNGTDTGGILARYQLLTPGIITTLLVTFFVLVPVLMVGIQALASIQSPLRNEIPKNFNAAEKKNQ
ncbi:hypothetical protein B0H16DRAFT_1790638, partial [Mycena metata]